LKNPDLLIFF